MSTRSIAYIAALNVAQKRKACGLTQAQVAERLGVEKESISRMESGKIMLNLERLQQFSQIFGCSVSELLSESSSEAVDQAHAIAEMISPLSPEERSAVVRFVGEAVRLFQSKKQSSRERGDV